MRALALLKVPDELATKRPELRKLLVDRFHPRAEGICNPAALVRRLRLPETEQVADVFEREAKKLSAPDEAETALVLLVVEAISRR